MSNSPSDLPQTAEADAEYEIEEERDDTIIGKAFLWSVIGFIIIGAGTTAAIFALKKEDDSDVVDQAPPPPPPKREEITNLPEIRFTDVTDSSGITFVHESGAAGEKLLPETMGGGCAILDFDGDGDQDIVFINSKRWDWDREKLDPPPEPATMSAWRNDGDWSFTDVTREIGLDISIYGQGAAVGDYDNDGDVDLYITAVGSNVLLRNEGGTFIDATETAGVAGESSAWSSSTGFFDYDNDGDLDLFVCNYLAWDREFDLAQEFVLTGDERAYGRPNVFEGQFPYLFENNSDGTFTDMSADSGVQVRNRNQDKPLAKSLGVTFADFDSDGWIDIFIANDTVQNLLFRNKGDKTFEEKGYRSGVAFDEMGVARGAMGTSVAWFRNDDSIGIAVGNFSNEMTALYVSLPGTTQFKDEAGLNGLGPFTLLDLTFGVCWGDMDLDGRVDLFAANGHLEVDIHRIQDTQHYEQPPQLFWNMGADSMTEFAALRAEHLGDDFVKPMVGRGAALADFDLDGDLDVLIVGCGQKPRLLKNDQAFDHHWVRFQLQGTKSNRSAIGAVIEITADGQTQRRQVMPTCSYISQSELPVSFGLGEATSIDSATIHWPDGTTQPLDNVEIDSVNAVKQP